MSEHRRSPRWQLNQQAELKLEQAIEGLFCQVKDINYKGMQVALGARLPQDSAIRMRLTFSGGCTFDAEVWVAWSKVINGITHYGLYFSRIKDADKEKIYNFAHTRLSKKVPENWWSESPDTAGKGEYLKKIENIAEAEETKEGDDYRIFERFPVNLPTRYLNLDTGEEGLADTQDVSAKGLGLALNRELKPHTALEIWLEMRDKGGPLYTRGEVVWSKMLGTDNYRLGVELDKADLMGISRVLRA